MKTKIRTTIVLLIISIFIMTLLSACTNPYDKVTEEDEKTILFVMSISSINMMGNGSNTCLCIDNMGNIYKWNSDKKIAEGIESKEIFECEIVNQISAEEVIDAYGNLCKMDEELFFISTHEEELATDRIIYYYGIRYMEGEAEIMRIGDGQHYTENRHAEDIVEWMNSWDWKSYL